MILETLAAIPLWTLYILCALSAGFRAVRYFPKLQSDRVIHLGFALSLGLGILATIWTLLAVVPEGFQPYKVLVILFFSGFSGWREVYEYAKTFDYKTLIPENNKLRWIAAPLAIILAMAPAMCWYPLGTDALAFYMAQAKIVAYTGHFVPLPGYESFSQIPLPAELTYTSLLVLGNEMAARMVTASQVWACALLVVALAIKCGAGVTGRWLAVLLLLTSTSVTLLMSDGKTDLYGAMIGLATLYAFVALPLTSRHIFMMGVLAGFSVMAKLSYIPILVPMLGMLLLWRYLQENSSLSAVRKTAVSGLIISGLVALSMIPLVLKNWIGYGEPFAPFMFIGNGEHHPVLEQSWFSPEITSWILKTYPFAWTYGQYPMQHGNLSPLVWAALPALLLAGWKPLLWFKDPAVALAVAGLLGMLSWAIFFPSVLAPRYIFPALMAFIPLAVRGLEALWNFLLDRERLHKAFTVILAAAAAMTFFYEIPQVANGLRWALYGPSKSHINYIWDGLKTAEELVPESSRLLLVGWERSLLEGRTLSCLIGQDEIGINRIIHSITPSVKYWEDFYKAGAKILVVNQIGRKDFADKIDLNSKPSWLDIDVRQVNSFYSVYLLHGKEGAPVPEKKCTQKPNGKWHTTSNLMENDG